MSTWQKIHGDCLEIDGDEINILVNSDDNGNNYITIDLQDMLSLIK